MREPTFDKDGYPTEETLRAIREWSSKDMRGLMQFVCDAWRYDDYVTLDGGSLELHTGGWSGNESIVHALQGNSMFWMMCWEKSERGGHYWFGLPNGGGEAR